MEGSKDEHIAETQECAQGGASWSLFLTLRKRVGQEIHLDRCCFGFLRFGCSYPGDVQYFVGELLSISQIVWFRYCSFRKMLKS